MKSKLLAILCALSLIGWSHAEEATSGNVAAITVDATNTTHYTTLEAALSAVETGQTITLLQSTELASATEISGKTLTIDLAEQTLTFSAEITGNLFSFKDGACVTFKNGTIDLSGVQTSANANFQVSDSAQMTFEEVKLIGENYKSSYAVLYAQDVCTGDPAIALKNCTVELKNEQSTLGGFLKAENTAAKFLISSCSITLTNPVRGIIQGDVTLENSSLTITGEGTSTTLDNGINSSNLTVKNSTIAISNGSGRGLTLAGSNTVSIDASSTVTIAQMGEGAVMFKDSITEGAKLTVAGSLTMDQAIVNKSTSIATDSVLSGSGQIVNTSLVAQIGEKLYTSLEAAIAAAETGDTITLLQDVTESGLTLADKQITLALDGHTIPAGSIVISGSGEVTVTGGTGSIPVSVDTTKGALLTIVEAEGAQTYCTGKLYYNNGELFAQGHALTIEGQDGTDSDTNLRLTYTEGGKSYTTLYTSTTAVRLFAGWKYPTVDTTDHAYTLTMKSGKVQSLRGSNKDKTGGSIASATIVMEGGTAEIIASAWYYCPSVSSFTVKISGGKVGTIYGNGETASTASSTITTYKEPTVMEAKIEISGGTVGFVYGGGRALTQADSSANYAMRTVKATIDISGGTVTCVNGGGFNGPEANWGEDSGQDQVIVEEAEITVHGGTVQNVFGGGYNGQWKWTYKYHESDGLVFSNYNGAKTTTVRNTVAKSTVNVQEGAEIANLYLGGRSYAYVAEAVANVSGGTVGTLSMSGNYGHIAKSTATVTGGQVNKAELLTRNYAGEVALTITGGTVGELYAGVGGAYKNSNSTEKETYNVCTLAVLGSATISATEGTVAAAYLTTGLEKATAVTCNLPLTVKTMNLVDAAATGDSAYAGTLSSSGHFAIEASTANWLAEIAFASTDESFKPLADTTGSLTYTSLVEGKVVGTAEDLTCSLVDAPPVAQIGETTYPSLEAAIAAAVAGDTVTLLQDVTVAATVKVEKAITIDLAEHTVTSSVGFVFEVTTGATIQNGTIEGGNIKVGSSEGTVTLEKLQVSGHPTLSSSNGALYVWKGAVIARQSTFVASYSGGYGVYLGSSATPVTLEGCTIKNSADSKKYALHIATTSASAEISIVNSTIESQVASANAINVTSSTKATITLGEGNTVLGRVELGRGSSSAWKLVVEGGKFAYEKDGVQSMPFYNSSTKYDIKEALIVTGGSFKVSDVAEYVQGGVLTDKGESEAYRYVVQPLSESCVAYVVSETGLKEYTSLEAALEAKPTVPIVVWKEASVSDLTALLGVTLTTGPAATLTVSATLKDLLGSGVTLSNAKVTTTDVALSQVSCAGGKLTDGIGFTADNYAAYAELLAEGFLFDAETYNVTPIARFKARIGSLGYDACGSGSAWGPDALEAAVANDSAESQVNDEVVLLSNSGDVFVPDTIWIAKPYATFTLDLNGHNVKQLLFTYKDVSDQSTYPHHAKVTVKNGTLKDGVDYGISTNGTVEGVTLALEQVQIQPAGADSWGIYFPSSGSLTIGEGCSITAGATGIEMRAGELTVNGGTIKSLAESYSVEANGSGTTTVGAGIAVAQHGTKLPLKVTVTGGTISGPVALSEANPQENEAEAIGRVSLDIQGGTFEAQSAAVVSADCTGFISGGYFSNAVPLAYCATGKVPKTLKAGDAGYQAEAPYTVVAPTHENFVAVKADGSAEVYAALASVPSDTKVYIAPSAETDEAVAEALNALATTGPVNEPRETTLTVKEVAEVLGGAFTVCQVEDAEAQTTETKLVYHYNFGVAGLEVNKQTATGELALTVVAKLTEGEIPADRTLVGRTLQVVLEKGDGTAAETYSVANPVFDDKGQCRVPVPWSAITQGTNAIKVKVVK